MKNATLVSVIFVIVVGIGSLLRFANIFYGLPLDLVGDEYVHVATAFSFLNGKTLIASQSFSYVPSLLAVLITPFFGVFGVLGMVLGWFSGLEGFKEFALMQTTWFIVAPRILSGVFGIVSLWLIYTLSRRVAGRDVALIATALASFDFWLVRESQLGHFWMPLVTLFLVGVYTLIRLYETGERRWYVYAALAIAVGFWAGYISILLLPFCLFAHVMTKKREWSNLVIGGGLVTILIGIIAYLNPVSVMRHLGFASRSSLDVLGLSAYTNLPESPLAALTVGEKVSRLVMTLYFDNPIILFLGVIGLALFAYRRSFESILFLGVSFLYFLLYLFVWPDPDLRYALPLIPFLTFGVAYTLVTLASVSTLQRVAVGLSIVLFIAAFAWSAETTVSYSTLMQKKDTRLVAYEWISKNIPSHAKVVVDAKYLELPKDEVVTHMLAEKDPSVLRTKDRYLLEHVDRFPTPAYFTLSEGDLAQLKGVEEKVQFDYIVRAFYSEADTVGQSPIPETFQLVAWFYPRNSVIELADLVQDPMNPLSALLKVNNLGPYVEVYAREK